MLHESLFHGFGSGRQIHVRELLWDNNNNNNNNTNHAIFDISIIH